MRQQILVVEDVPDLRDLVKQVFVEEGFECETAAHGLEALEILAKMERPGLILLDLMMPFMNGWEFRKAQLRDPRLASIPVILVSAGGNVNDQAYNIGAADYMRKPYDHETLLRAAHTYCEEPAAQKRSA
jgi:CheY-like chemotaxis protein